MAVSFRPSVSSSPVTVIPSSTNYCKTNEKGFWYYDAMEEKRVSGPTVYRELLESAHHNIDVWDSYLTKRDANLFNSIGARMKVRILTTINQKGEVDKGYDNYFRFLEEIKTIQATNGFSLIVMGICRSSHQKLSSGRIPHDRFLFVDDRVFIVGSSLHYHSIEDDNEHVLDIANTTITELTLDENKKILKNDFESYWDKTNPKNKYVDILCDEPGALIK